MDKASIRVVVEDLEHLRADWGPSISEPNARRGSAVLRRLLVEDAYGAAWRAVGLAREPTVTAVDLSILLADTPPQEIRYALAAGAEYRGIRIAGMVVGKRFDSIQAPIRPPVRPDGYPGEADFGMAQYLSSISGIVDGRSFTRRDLIKYIANVRGGVHLQAKERRAERKLVERVSKIEKRILVHNSEGLLVELVAIGQAVGRSDDASKFIAACRTMGA